MNDQLTENLINTAFERTDTRTIAHAFVKAYFATARWTDPPEGRADFYTDWHAQQICDCVSFLARTHFYFNPENAAQAGHDFWLTRNGHGAGFWDGDWDTLGDVLTKISHSYGETEVQYRYE